MLEIVLVQMNRIYLANHPELARMRAEKDIKYLMNEIDKKINESMDESVSTNGMSVNSVTIYLGYRATIYSCHTGNTGGSRSGIADWAAKYSASGRWADVSTSTAGWGEASGWSWVGPQVYVSGPAGARQWAYVTFNFNGAGSILGGVGGSATGKIRVSIWDYTRGSEIGGYVVWEQTSQNNFPKGVNRSFSPTIGCYLEAGHTYAFRFGVSGAVSQYGAQYTYTDFWNDGPGPGGLDVSHVVVEF